jgi:hypothetical protein
VICFHFAQLYFVYFLKLHISEHWIFEKSMVESKRHGADLQKRTGILGSAEHLDRGANGGGSGAAIFQSQMAAAARRDRERATSVS